MRICSVRVQGKYFLCVRGARKTLFLCFVCVKFIIFHIFAIRDGAAELKTQHDNAGGNAKQMDERNEGVAISMVCFGRKCWPPVVLYGE